MTDSDPGRIALRFVNEINRHDLEALSHMMSPDVVRVDPLGHQVRGRDRSCAEWAREFHDTPDLRISIHDHLTQGALVALFGTESGTHEGIVGSPRQHWSHPSAFRVVVRDAHVAEWQEFSEPELAKRPAPTAPR